MGLRCGDCSGHVMQNYSHFSLLFYENGTGNLDWYMHIQSTKARGEHLEVRWTGTAWRDGNRKRIATAQPGVCCKAVNVQCFASDNLIYALYS